MPKKLKPNIEQFIKEYRKAKFELHKDNDTRYQVIIDMLNEYLVSFKEKTIPLFYEVHNNAIDMAIEALPKEVKISKYVHLVDNDEEIEEKLKALKIKL